MSLRPNTGIFGIGSSHRASQAAARQPVQSSRPELRVLIGGGETPRQVRLGRARLIASVAAVGLVLFAVVMFHVMLTQGQFKLESLEARADDEQAQFEKLRYEVARLESPSRITDEAERLGMVPAADVATVAPAAGDIAADVAAGASPLVGVGDADSADNNGGDAPNGQSRAQSWADIKPHLSSSSR